MMTFVAVAVFASAMALAILVIWATVAPQWSRITRLAMGHVEQSVQPLEALVNAERRIAIRHWAATSAPAPIHRSHVSA